MASQDTASPGMAIPGPGSRATGRHRRARRPRYGDSAPKPGVIPLRPLGLGEILDGSFASIRRNPKATLGIAAIIMTISAVITSSLAVSLVNLPSPGQNLSSQQAAHLLGHIFAEALPVLGVTVLLTIIVQAVLAGLLAPIIAREVSGQRISAGDAWRVAAPRLPRVLLATLLVVLAGLGPLLLLGLILLIGFAAGAPPVIYAAIGVPGFFVAVVLSIWFSTMFSLVTPVVVLERERPGAALARSWRLVRRSFWRVFGILLLAGLIVAVASAILQLPFSFLSTLFGGATGFSAGTVIAVIGTIAAGTVTRPISAAVTVLLYVDMRMRKEGLDLALRTAAGDGPLADSDFAAAWQPPRAGQPPAAAPAGPRRRRPRPPRVPRRRGERGRLGLLRPAGGTPLVGHRRPAGRAGRPEPGPHRAVQGHLPSARVAGPAAARCDRPAAERPVHRGQVVPRRLVVGGRPDRTDRAGRRPGTGPAGPAGPGTPRSRPGGARRAAAQRGRSPAARGSLASAGDYAAAILEAVRGIARQLEERGILSPRLGRTADEIAAEAGLALPADAAALHDAARLFDDICYGERPGTADGYALVQSLDSRLQSARPAEPSTSDAA